MEAIDLMKFVPLIKAEDFSEIERCVEYAHDDGTCIRLTSRIEVNGRMVSVSRDLEPEFRGCVEFDLLMVGAYSKEGDELECSNMDKFRTALYEIVNE